MTPPWTFNIVYTAGTVAYLLPFVHSLLAHTDACFRLVANGCLLPEQRMLEAYCRRNDRLAFWSTPGPHCLPHGEVLDTLRQLPTPGPFCFLDSDVVASGPFLPALREVALRAPAVFSGAPSWLPDGDGVFRPGFRSLTGEYLWDDAGACLGGTYVAVYDAAQLARTVGAFGIGFEPQGWDDLPAGVRAVLVRRARIARRYDTGKVVNSLLQAPGGYVNLPGLHHLGGISFPALRPRRSSRLERWGAGGGAWRWAARSLHRLRVLRSYRRFGSDAEARALYHRRVYFRDPVRAYFWQLLRALSTRAPEPPVPATACDGVNLRVQQATQAIRQCYQAFHVADPAPATSLPHA